MKNQSASKLVFFSYSWKDQAIAMKIFYDLTRSNISVWRDQVDAEKANFNFLESIFKVIDDVEYFLLIDSPHSRASFFVSEEVRHFLKIQENNSNKKLIICLVGNQEETHQTNELFKQQNYWSFFDFSGVKVYDTHKKYNNSISKLIECLGGEFVPWTNLPDGNDFEDEISAAKITDEDRQSLITDFDTFKLRHQNEYSNLDKRLLILIEDCQEMGVLSITPYLSLGVLYAEQFKKENNPKKLFEAKDIFEETCQRFPNDPRAWRGLGGTAFHTENYEEALYAFTEAIIVTIKIQNKNHLKYLNLIYEDKAETLIKLNRQEEALEIFKTLFFDTNKNHCINPNHFINIAFCYFQLEKYAQCEEVLLGGLRKFPNDASILLELGNFYTEMQDYETSIFYYEKAIKYKPNQISLLVSLCILLYFFGEKWKFNRQANSLFNLKPATEAEYYQIGRIYFFKKNFSKSLEYFKKSKGCLGPYYDKLED